MRFFTTTDVFGSKHGFRWAPEASVAGFASRSATIRSGQGVIFQRESVRKSKSSWDQVGTNFRGRRQWPQAIRIRRPRRARGVWGKGRNTFKCMVLYGIGGRGLGLSGWAKEIQASAGDRAGARARATFPFFGRVWVKTWVPPGFRSVLRGIWTPFGDDSESRM